MNEDNIILEQRVDSSWCLTKLCNILHTKGLTQSCQVWPALLKMCKWVNGQRQFSNLMPLYVCQFNATWPWPMYHSLGRSHAYGICVNVCMKFVGDFLKQLNLNECCRMCCLKSSRFKRTWISAFSMSVLACFFSLSYWPPPPLTFESRITSLQIE